MTNSPKAPHEQQPTHQAPLDVEAAEALVANFGQPAQEQQQQEVPAQAPAPEISQSADSEDIDYMALSRQGGEGETTLADDLLSGGSEAEGGTNVHDYLEARRKELPSLMSYSLASQAYMANPKESPRPQLFLDNVSAEERKHLTPGDVSLLPEDLILAEPKEFVDTLPKPVQEAWREEAAERRNEFNQWTPKDVENLVAEGKLHEVPDEVAQHMPPAAQQAWEKAAGRPISAAPFESSPAVLVSPTQQPKGKFSFGGRFGKGGRGKDTTATTQETEPVVADNSADNAQEAASADYVFSKADGIDEKSPFYGKSEGELIDEIFDMPDEKVDKLSDEEYEIYKRVEDAAYELAAARAGNPDREMVGPESDPGARGKMAKVAAFAGKVASKLRRKKGEQSEPAVTSESYRVSEEDADGVERFVNLTDEQLLSDITIGDSLSMSDHEKEVLGKLQKGARARLLDTAVHEMQGPAEEVANEPSRLKKVTAAIGGVASRAGNLVRRDRNGEGSGEQGEQQPERPLKERAKELANKILEGGKVGDALALAKNKMDMVILDAITAIPKVGAYLQNRVYDTIEDPSGRRKITPEGRVIATALAAVGILATYLAVEHAIDGSGTGGGAANTAHDTGETAANQPGAAGSTSSSTEVTTTTTGAPSSSEAADATTTGAPSSSTEVDTTTTGAPSSSVDTTEAAVPTGSSTSTEVDTTTTGSTPSDAEAYPGNVGAGEHAIDAETTQATTGSPSSSSAETTTETTTTTGTTTTTQQPNGGTTPSPEAPATDTSDTPDQPTPEPGAPQTPDTSGMDKVADPANQPAYSPGVSELQPGGNVWDSSEQFWVDRGFTGSQNDLTKLTDAMKDWRLEQMGVSEADAVNLRPGTPLPMPTPDQISEIIARSGV